MTTHRMTRPAALFLALSLLCSGHWIAANTAPEQPADMTAGDRICEVVGLKVKPGGGYPAALPAIMKRAKPDDPIQMDKAACDRLRVEIAAEGIATNSLMDEIARNLHIQGSAKPGPVFQIVGRPEDRVRLVQHLLEASRDASAPLDERKSLARTAVGVACLNRTGAGAEYLRTLLMDSSLHATLSLSEQEVAQLRRIADELAPEQLGARLSEVATELEALISGAGSHELRQQRWETFATKLTEAWILSSERADIRLLVARQLWRALCLARADNDPDRLQSLQALARSLDARTTAPASKRWLAEALRADGPRPASAGRKVIQTPHDVKPGTP